MSDRKIQERTEYRDEHGALIVAEDWQDVPGETFGQLSHARERVRQLNAAAKAKGSFTRYRSVADDSFWTR